MRQVSQHGVRVLCVKERERGEPNGCSCRAKKIGKDLVDAIVGFR